MGKKKPRAIKTRANREIRLAKLASAAEAIGRIEPDTDTFILTYGQFSLIDALVAILDQTGPADVTLATWTAADAHLERSAELVESAAIRSFRLIIDRSFESRQPEYCEHMRRLFGQDCIRVLRIHAKFMLVRSDTHNIVVRTSMNMNENPRLENIEVSEDRRLAEFFQTVSDDIFREIKPGENRSALAALGSIPEHAKFKEIRADQIPRKKLNVPETTHTVTRLD